MTSAWARSRVAPGWMRSGASASSAKGARPLVSERRLLPAECVEFRRVRAAAARGVSRRRRASSAARRSKPVARERRRSAASRRVCIAASVRQPFPQRLCLPGGFHPHRDGTARQRDCPRRGAASLRGGGASARPAPRRGSRPLPAGVRPASVPAGGASNVCFGERSGKRPMAPSPFPPDGGTSSSTETRPR